MSLSALNDDPPSAAASLDWEGLSAKLPTEKGAAASKTRRELWHRSDPNENGFVTLAEFEEMIGAHLRAVVGKQKFSAPWWHRQLARDGAPPKKPDLRMALAATLRCGNVQPSVVPSGLAAGLDLMSPMDLRVERTQFRTMLIALRESIKKALDITEEALVDAVKKALEDEAKPPEPPQLLSPRTQGALAVGEFLISKGGAAAETSPTKHAPSLGGLYFPPDAPLPKLCYSYKGAVVPIQTTSKFDPTDVTCKSVNRMHRTHEMPPEHAVGAPVLGDPCLACKCSSRRAPSPQVGAPVLGGVPARNLKNSKFTPHHPIPPMGAPYGLPFALGQVPLMTSDGL